MIKLPTLEKDSLEKLNMDLTRFLTNSKQTNIRTAVMSDFLTNNRAYIETQYNEKPKNYRIQGEYGEKKVIKP